MKEYTLVINGHSFRAHHELRANYPCIKFPASRLKTIYQHYQKVGEKNRNSYEALENKYRDMNYTLDFKIHERGVVCGGSWSYTYIAQGEDNNGTPLLFKETKDNSYVTVFDL